MISLLNHADRVTSASLAQLVNVIAPIMTEPGGPAWKQTTFFPFAETARSAQGSALRVVLDADTTSTATFGEVPVVDAAATRDGSSVSVFLENRSIDEPTEITIELSALSVEGGEVRAVGIWDDDLDAVNDLSNTERVGLRTNDTVRREGGSLTLTLPPVSWTAVTIG
jgi:alpha-N-arabinofuranosidase